jgi:alkanesulfonate monooxygenase SsuD/methylene tetrahydromethanopterin reductase-like flavin-dependent oxidoreductase (luciferase family)
MFMRFGFVIPGGNPRTAADLAHEAEAAGWDGVFYPDCIFIAHGDDYFPAYDPWVALAAMAMRTEQVILGPMITPIARRRPWKLARETMSVDRLSNGRLVLMVGLGALDDGGFTKVGEPQDRQTRAELLDEGLEILAGLWSGMPFGFDGRHFHLQEMAFQPTPVQSPRIPIWVVAAWPRVRSMQRAARWDGIIPAKMDNAGTFDTLAPADIVAMRSWLAARRPPDAPFEIVTEGETPGGDLVQAAERVRPWAEAGVTWWLETLWSASGPEPVLARIRQGPPVVQ